MRQSRIPTYSPMSKIGFMSSFPAHASRLKKRKNHREKGVDTWGSVNAAMAVKPDLNPCRLSSGYEEWTSFLNEFHW